MHSVDFVIGTVSNLSPLNLHFQHITNVTMDSVQTECSLTALHVCIDAVCPIRIFICYIECIPQVIMLIQEHDICL